ncbi:MAG: hypothetical protein QUU85_09785 [Candidatus Eisenbacteria bacterium]|nr:hypothetical protein [Candidatus Eisenbacteria bacterium]
MGLALDSRLAAALPGIRGTTALQPRQLLFESEAGNLHLRIEPEASKKLQIFGQFLPANVTPAEPISGTVTLESDGRETTRKLTPHGEFQFRAVKPSEVRIKIGWNDLVLSLGPLDLSAGPGR